MLSSHNILSFQVFQWLFSLQVAPSHPRLHCIVLWVRGHGIVIYFSIFRFLFLTRIKSSVQSLCNVNCWVFTLHCDENTTNTGSSNAVIKQRTKHLVALCEIIVLYSHASSSSRMCVSRRYVHVFGSVFWDISANTVFENKVSKRIFYVSELR